MTDELISFDTAKLAKEKGFDFGPGYYVNEVPNYVILNICQPPTQSLLQRWLREVHKINVSAPYQRGNWCYIIETLPSDDDIKFAASGRCQDGDLWLDATLVNTEWYLDCYTTYEQALEAGLQEALKLVK